MTHQSTSRLTNPRLNLIEERLGENLAAYINDRRPDTAWRLIAADLRTRTRVDITGEALRLWHGGLEHAA